MLTILISVAQQTGYLPNPIVNMTLPIFPANGSLAAGQVISGTSGATAGMDTVTTQFAIVSGDDTMNCLDQTNTTGAQQVYINTLSVNANNEPQCTMTFIPSGVTTMVSLMSGITRSSVLYGTDTNSSGYDDSYLTAA